jgi:hypothetical protein
MIFRFFLPALRYSMIFLVLFTGCLAGCYLYYTSKRCFLSRGRLPVGAVLSAGQILRFSQDDNVAYLQMSSRGDATLPNA